MRVQEEQVAAVRNQQCEYEEENTGIKTDGGEEKQGQKARNGRGKKRENRTQGDVMYYVFPSRLQNRSGNLVTPSAISLLLSPK